MLLTSPSMPVAERRQFPRIDTCIPVSVSVLKRGRPSAVEPAEILDYSRGGICLMLRHKPKRGQRLSVLTNAEGKRTRPSAFETRWIAALGDCFLVGAQRIGSAQRRALQKKVREDAVGE